jgi:hypothetical protein
VIIDPDHTIETQQAPTGPPSPTPAAAMNDPRRHRGESPSAGAGSSSRRLTETPMKPIRPP